jgi:predicted RNase H-like nuclease
MSPQESFEVAGVDGCKAGWFVVIASATKTRRAGHRHALKFKDFCVARNFAEVLAKTRDCRLVCIDIPFGLSDTAEPRECDVAARQLLGGRRASSVFPPPIRQCLWAKDPQTASNICLEHSGKKLNRQSFFIMPKIRDVDQVMTPELQRRVREIHPEISFWALNGKKPTQHNKKRLVGRNERIRLLAPIFPAVQKLIAEARRPKQAAPDDILDALVAAWTAGRAAVGKAETLPQKPKLDGKGLRMEILYPVASAPDAQTGLDGASPRIYDYRKLSS